MIEILILAAVGILSGVVAYWTLNRNKIEICGRSELNKRGYINISLPNGCIMTIWESLTEPGKIVACCHTDKDNIVGSGDLVYFTKDKITDVIKASTDVSKSQKENSNQK